MTNDNVGININIVVTEHGVKPVVSIGQWWDSKGTGYGHPMPETKLSTHKHGLVIYKRVLAFAEEIEA